LYKDKFERKAKAHRQRSTGFYQNPEGYLCMNIAASTETLKNDSQNTSQAFMPVNILM